MALFRKKTRLEKLKKRYTDLMRQSYQTALKSREESEKIRQRAERIFDEIKYLSIRYADK
jgi:hypothetical protein